MLELNLLGLGDRGDIGHWFINPQSYENVEGIFVWSLTLNSSIGWWEDKAIVVFEGFEVTPFERRNRQCHAGNDCKIHAVCKLNKETLSECNLGFHERNSSNVVCGYHSLPNQYRLYAYYDTTVSESQCMRSTAHTSTASHPS